LYNLAADGWRRRGTKIAGLRKLRAGVAGDRPAGIALGESWT
jgi:hypothetical protein